MATLADRLPGNAPGEYYVDASCIDCNQCRAMAPGFFARDPESGLSLVHRQPRSDEELALVAEALACCALGSIGNDGT